MGAETSQILALPFNTELWEPELRSIFLVLLVSWYRVVSVAVSEEVFAFSPGLAPAAS